MAGLQVFSNNFHIINETILDVIVDPDPPALFLTEMNVRQMHETNTHL